MEKEGNEPAINQCLTVIRYAGVAAILTGIGSITCGILTLIFSDPIWDFPYTSGSGIWAGIIVLLYGVFGVLLAMKYDMQHKSASCHLVSLFSGFSVVCFITGGQHFGYSISATVQCGTRTTRGDNITEKCNAAEHDNLIIVSSFGIVFGILIFALGMLGFTYVRRRGGLLTGNPNFGKGCCGSNCN